MASQDDIDEQQELLATHRRTLATLLAQQATFTSAYTPPAVSAGSAGEQRAVEAAQQKPTRRSPPP